MNYEWDERASDEIVDQANRSRKHAQDAGHVYAMMHQIAGDPKQHSGDCVDAGSWRLCWWAYGNVRAYFAFDDNCLVVLHVSETSAPSALSEAQRRFEEYGP